MVHVFEDGRVILEGALAVGARNSGHRDRVSRVECAPSSSEISLTTHLFPVIMSQPIDTERLSFYTDLMNELLPVIFHKFHPLIFSNIYFWQVNEIAGDPQQTVEARQSLLRDVRSVRDTYAQERARAENQLFAAQQNVSALATELRIADEKLTTIEDLIGEVRTRMQTRGLATHPAVRRLPLKSSLSAGVTTETPPREFY